MDDPERRILSLDQTEALLDAARKFGGGRRWAYIAMACLSGLRREEILRLSPDQVNLSEGYILAPAIKSKTRRRDRFLEDLRLEFDAIRMLAGLADDWQDDVMRPFRGDRVYLGRGSVFGSPGVKPVATR